MVVLIQQLTVSILVLLLWSAASVSGHVADHRYKQGDHVDLWVNKVRAFPAAAGA